MKSQHVRLLYRNGEAIRPIKGTYPHIPSTPREVGVAHDHEFRSFVSGGPFWVCAVQRRRFPVGASPTRQSLQPEAIGAVMEVTKWLKPPISVSQIGDCASVQAATRVNAEQSSKRTMRRSTRQPYRGRLIRPDEMGEAIRSDAAPRWWRRHVHKESARNTGSPKAWSAMTNRKPVRDRPGALGWRRGS